MDDNRSYVDGNPAACALLRMTLAEIRESSVDDFVAAEHRPLIAEGWQNFLTAGQSRGATRFELPDGTNIEVEYSASAHFVPGFHLSILRDCTARIQAEQQLRESEEEFRSVVATIPQQVWTACPDGALDYLSPRVMEYSGLSREELIGRGWQSILHPDDVPGCLALWSHSLATGENYEVEFRLKAADGKYRWHLGRALPRRDAAGRICRWFGSNTDITEHKQLETERIEMLEKEQAALAAAQASNQAKDEFLATLAHELRSPVTAILGWTALLKNRDLDRNHVEQAATSIERSARTQARLIEDSLDVSRIILGTMRIEARRIDPSGVVNAALDATRPAAAEKQITLAGAVPEGAIAVRADAQRLLQVMLNLLTNAVKFTPGGGTVSVDLTQRDGTVEIQVQDNGQGISPEFLPHVFDRLRQERPAGGGPRSRAGLGLGLSISRHLMEAQGGQIRVDSDGPGLGSVFTVSLPADDAAGAECG